MCGAVEALIRNAALCSTHKDARVDNNSEIDDIISSNSLLYKNRTARKTKEKTNVGVLHAQTESPHDATEGSQEAREGSQEAREGSQEAREGSQEAK